jgi:hypothetical protein
MNAFSRSPDPDGFAHYVHRHRGVLLGKDGVILHSYESIYRNIVLHTCQHGVYDE